MTNNTMADSTGDEALDPAAMLALVQNQQRSIGVQRGGFATAIMAAWGIAWLLGFLALWLIDGLEPGFGLPLAAGVSVFVGLLVAAIAVSAVLGVRGVRGVRTGRESSFAGTVYGITWSLGSLALVVLGWGLYTQGLTAGLANFFYPSAYVFFAGIMYIAAGAIWRSMPSVIGGAILVVVAAVAPFFPYPWHYLFFAVAGGGTFIGLALRSALQSRHLRAVARG